jgi:GNAT superfamily N-acetyltransferase
MRRNLVKIQHVETGEQDLLASRHPELAQHPELNKPFMASNGPSDASFPYLFYAVEDGQIASYFRSFPDILNWGDRSFRWAWNGGLYTAPAFRGRGIAQRIVQLQLDEFARRDIIWGGVFSSPAALRLYERMKFCMPGHAARLCILRNIRPFLRHHTGNPIAVSAAGLTFGAAFAAAQTLLFRIADFKRNYYLDIIDGRGFAALLARRSLVRPQKYYWGRDASWFEARLAAIDNIHVIHRRGEIEPCAFLIIRERTIQKRPIKEKYTGIKMMSVMEFGQFDEGPDIPDALVGASLMLFKESDADLLEFVTSSAPIQAAARRRGFLPLGAGMSFKFMAPPGNPLCGIETTLSDWHLTHYCGDAFGFE